MAARKTETRKLYRSETDKILGGVAGGLGEYFEVDSTLLRIIFVLLTVFGGSGILIYLALWILIPSEGHLGKTSDYTIKANAKEMSDKAKTFAKEFKGANRETNWLGIIIVVVGILFLTDNLGFLRFGLFWPLILIVFGIFLLTREK